ncbi:TetR/AcrR family transcriptional regulator [Streptomyces profundus]|uniref:TetR/AcrR family transcriptional regulator n=1 Tax=Streptomyces profundus TaxID=2867410 RepID=UPI001D16BFA0|nr:TetR/AcrR family transcriptional regulator [Streptomyces sp. MA3_2.13]
MAILDAAVSLLAESPDASVAAVGRAAGVTRQTVYAHFPSRQALLSAVLDRVTEESLAAMDAAEEGADSAIDALRRMIDASWRTGERYPLLADISTAAVDPEVDSERHLPVIERLIQLIERGQAAGEFAPEPPASWLASATVALGHAAAEEAVAGRFSRAEALAALHISLHRLLTAPSAPL